MRLLLALSIFLALSCATAVYSPAAAVTWADSHWNQANHDCATAYSACSPQGYYGSEHCGFPSQGGNCANFVSQSLVLGGGHANLNGGTEYCRGYCGISEIGARRLGQCLELTHSWTRTCGHKHEPPANLAEGDVLIFHKNNCDSYKAHATIVTGVTRATNPVTGASEITGVQITCHSPQLHDEEYTYYEATMPYYEWLTHPTADTGAVNTGASAAVQEVVANAYKGAGDEDAIDASAVGKGIGADIAAAAAKGGGAAAAKGAHATHATPKDVTLEVNANAAAHKRMHAAIIRKKNEAAAKKDD